VSPFPVFRFPVSGFSSPLSSASNAAGFEKKEKKSQNSIKRAVFVIKREDSKGSAL